jgi:mannitol-1-/sugar-/sorbitol-6-phosphatase
LILSCDAVLFDMDGTIVDSNACVVRQWQRWAKRHGLDVDRVLAVSHGRRTIETMRMLAPGVDLEIEAERFILEEAADLDDITAVAGAVDLIRGMPRERWAVVTSSPRSVARPRLQCAGFPEPRVLITADDVARGKPDPEPYLTAAQRLGFAPERCLVFEDANSGVESARAAGMQVIGVDYLHREQLDCEHVIGSLAVVRVHSAAELRITIG